MNWTRLRKNLRFFLLNLNAKWECNNFSIHTFHQIEMLMFDEALKQSKKKSVYRIVIPLEWIDNRRIFFLHFYQRITMMKAR